MAEPTLDAAELVEKGRKLYLDTYFGEAITELDRALQLSPPERLRVDAKFLLALCFFALGNEDRARTAFKEVLGLNADFALPEMTSPKVRAFFDEVRASFRVIPKLSHTPPQTIDASQGASFTVQIENMRPGYEAMLHFRLREEGDYSRIDLSATPEQKKIYTALIPGSLLLREEGYTLSYFIDVSDAAHVALISLRSTESPFSVPVNVPIAQASTTPVYKKWWFWTIVGGVVLAGAATAVAVVLTQEPPTGDASITFLAVSGR